MNRVTIFSAAGCNHCDRLKAAFAVRNVAYTEISLSSHPERIFDLVSLCDRNGVPQVFFDGEHVGGGDDTIFLLDKWDQQFFPNPIERFIFETISPNGAFNDVRLMPSEAKPQNLPTAPPRNEEENTVELPDGEFVTTLELISILTIIMPRSDLRHRARIYKDCFTGREGVVALMEHYEMTDPEEAVQFGRRLQQSQILDHVCGDHDFGNSDYYFRLQPYKQPKVLNSFRIWTERVDPDTMGLLGRLKHLMDKIVSNATDRATGLVDYLFAESDPHYLIFEEEVCELQGVSLGAMDQDSRLAFSINLYNMMIKHALIKVGVATTSAQRASFYSALCYNIGGHILSFNQIEHGIIRSNSHPPFQLTRPFSKDDKRAALAMSKLDPRIHFAINCGAKSCPPVKTFTAEGVNEELDIVAQAFCEEDDNVAIDDEKNEIILSMIFSWYRADFADSTSKLPKIIVNYLRAERKEKLQGMIGMKKKITVKFKPYDWTVAASSSKAFESSKIADRNEVTLKAFFSGKSLLCGGHVPSAHDDAYAMFP